MQNNFKVTKSETMNVSWNGTELRTPMAALKDLSNVDVYGMLNSEALLDCKTQRPVIDMACNGENIPAKLLVFSGGHLHRASLLNDRYLAGTDGKTYRLLTVIETLTGTAGDTATFIGFNLYEIKGA